jgi:hypothetical protein
MECHAYGPPARDGRSFAVASNQDLAFLDQQLFEFWQY